MNSTNLSDETLLLTQLVNGYSLTAADRTCLIQSLVQSLYVAPHLCWQITNSEPLAELEKQVEERSRQFTAIYPHLNRFCQTQLGWDHCSLELLWRLWLPLALQLQTWRQTIDRPLIQGILGGQGTGKTTLAAILAEILSHLGWQVCRLSIDDLYKTYAERQQLQQVDPRFRWRGPPSTHDVDLGLQVLQQLRDRRYPVDLPRFDKSLWQGMGDRAQPETVTHADIVLFEGWFIGTRPIDPAAFAQAPAPIETESDRQFARDVNTKLYEYLPLWDRIDRLIVLYAADYRLSQQWRRDAEHDMTQTGRSGMTDQQVNQFVTYFWRSLHPDLFIQPLLNDPEHVDLAIEIDSHHCPIQVRQLRAN